MGDNKIVVVVTICQDRMSLFARNKTINKIETTNDRLYRRSVTRFHVDDRLYRRSVTRFHVVDSGVYTVLLCHVSCKKNIRYMVCILLSIVLWTARSLVFEY